MKRGPMKRLFFTLTFACLAFSLLSRSAFAQAAAPNAAPGADDPASREDVSKLLDTMRSHDLMQKMMAIQAQNVEQAIHDQLKDKGAVPSDFDAQMKKSIDGMLKNMPVDDVVQAMIPAYQKHFTHGDIEAMSAFYASPVGQKVVEELPAVTQEGMQAAMPILTKYMQVWEDRMKHDMQSSPKTSAPKGQS
jgi:hypothetical protein